MLKRRKMRCETPRRPILCLLAVFMLVPFLAQAQVRVTGIDVDFRVNSAIIEPNFGENEEHLEKIISFIDEINSDSTLSILRITFCGSVSPEGSLQLNRRLAYNRLKALEQYVRSRTVLPDSVITYDDSYIPWGQFRELVEDMEFDHKDKVLDIINKEESYVNYYENSQISSRVIELMQLEGGSVWRQLHAVFHDMRSAFAIFVTYKQPPIAAIKTDDSKPSTDISAIPSGICPLVIVPPAADEYSHLHIATNLPAWGLLMSNATLEIDFARRWSLALPVYYSALNYFADNVKFRTVTIQPELRYWFRGCESSWYAGAHMGLSYFNVAWGDLFRYQDHNMNTPAIGGGLTVGYRMPLGESKHWHRL